MKLSGDSANSLNPRPMIKRPSIGGAKQPIVAIRVHERLIITGVEVPSRAHD